jgi:phosphatidylglycerol:prolipoprotein diacylglycerol transferase
LNAIILPEFPKGFHLGHIFIHFYALAYITALLIGWRLVRRMCAEPPAAASGLQVDDFLTWATMGIILGGRLGYVLFYQPGYFFTHPLDIFAVWDGGMSSHGGFIGVTIAIIWFCTKEHINILLFADRIAIAVPIGLGLGRCANFINGELWGRAAAPWFPFAMIFPSPAAGFIPRYPSELIEAATEGVLLFGIIFGLSRIPSIRASPGKLTGIFLILYACARIFSECFREPDAFLGFLPFGTTMGQILSLPMIIIGLGISLYGARFSPIRDAARAV